jgi:hypothetical protein
LISADLRTGRLDCPKQLAEQQERTLVRPRQIVADVGAARTTAL